MIAATIAAFAALTPAPATPDVSECEVVGREFDLYVEQTSPFMPPQPLENPRITTFLECAFMELVPTASGNGVMTRRTTQLFTLVEEGDDVRLLRAELDDMPDDDDVIQGN